MIVVRQFTQGDKAEWLRMRAILYADYPAPEQEREVDECLASHAEVVFFVERPEGGLCGFIEASIRPWAVNCEAMPVGYLESWYVDADSRQAGIGRALVRAAEAWAKSKGCRQMASDAELWNTVSQDAHIAIGYEETMRLVLYKKDLA